VAALLLKADGTCTGGFTFRQLAAERKGKERDQFKDDLARNILVVDARLGGLTDGLLDKDADSDPPTADDGKSWLQEDGRPIVPFRIRRGTESQEAEDGWHSESEFDLRRNDEGEPLEWLVVEHFKDAAQKEDGRSVANPQTLAEHQSWARDAMRDIAGATGLPIAAVEALCLAAGLHDEGKKAWRWQLAFKAARDATKYGLSGPLAKTRGPINQALLDGYRHEFGSLRHVEDHPEFQALPDEWRDFVLHVVAAHHGFARPVIATHGCNDESIAEIEQRARDVTLRFARLQKRWGPWGLAWWEALLRAADARASRENDNRDIRNDTRNPGEVA
jgi:CRISPR-associated endonuclease/helicase Cas3